MIILYNIALFLLLLLFFPYVLFRLFGERKHRIGLLQRLGFVPRSVLRQRTGSPVIWVHSVSVGEILAAAPLIAEIRTRFPANQLLLSTTTVTGHRVCLKRVAIPGDLVIFFPLDLAFILRRVIALFSPRLILLMETEIWPNLISQARRRGIRLLLVNGRLSETSFRRYSKFKPFIGPFIRSFSFVGMQTQQGREKMLALGANPNAVSVMGSMKYEAALSSVPPPSKVAGLRQELAIPESGVIVAGSTHRGEEQIIARAFLELLKKHPTLFLVIAPRHPERFGEARNVLRQRNIRFILRSSGMPVPSDCRVMLLDTLGELSTFYALSTVAFIGKTLTRRGGHNPLEPAACARPVVFGPHMDNFREVADLLIFEGGALEVSGFQELISAFDTLISDEKAATAMGRRARTTLEAQTGGVERVISQLRTLLEEGESISRGG